MIILNNYLVFSLTTAEAIVEAGKTRLRAILLTSLTTFAGLSPIIFDGSSQAQFLIPMAVSLGFGILFATFTILFALPIILNMQDAMSRIIGQMKYGKAFQKTEI